jgi:hypothetical protein
MAGSYRHVVDDEGEFRGVELIDNLGDAYEALEECVAMIKQLANDDKSVIYQAWLEGYAKPNYPPENIEDCTYEDFWHED